jgi:hypothetical protein
MKPGLYEARSLLGGGTAVIELLDGPGERRRLAELFEVLRTIRALSLPGRIAHLADAALDVDGSVYSYVPLAVDVEEG